MAKPDLDDIRDSASIGGTTAQDWDTAAETINSLADLKSDTVDRFVRGAKKARSTKSIIGMAARNTFDFPVFISKSIPLDYATATNQLLEQLYAAYVQMAISQNSIVDAKTFKNGGFLAGFQTNITKYVEYTDTIYQHDACHNEIVTETARFIFDMLNCSDKDSREILENMDYTPMSEFDHFFQEGGGSGSKRNWQDELDDRVNKRTRERDDYANKGDNYFQSKATTEKDDQVKTIDTGDREVITNKKASTGKSTTIQTRRSGGEHGRIVNQGGGNAAQGGQGGQGYGGGETFDTVVTSERTRNPKEHTSQHTSQKRSKETTTGGGSTVTTTPSTAEKVATAQKHVQADQQIRQAEADLMESEARYKQLEKQTEQIQQAIDLAEERNDRDNAKELRDALKDMRDAQHVAQQMKNLKTQRLQMIRDMRIAEERNDREKLDELRKQEKHLGDMAKQTLELEDLAMNLVYDNGQLSKTGAGRLILNKRIKAKYDAQIASIDASLKAKDLANYDKRLKREEEEHNLRMMTHAPEVLKEEDMKKMNSMKPLLMKCQMRIIDSHDNVSDKPVEYVFGVHTHCRLIDADTLPDVVKYPLKEMNEIARKAKWKAGELKFLRDIVFQVKEKKQTAVDSRDPKRKWYRRLYQLAHEKGDANVSGMVSGNATTGLIPNATIMMSNSDVEYVKAQTKLDVLKPSLAKRLCNELFLIALVVIDQDAESIKLFIPELYGDWEVHSLASVEKQLAELSTAGSKTRDLFKLLK